MRLPELIRRRRKALKMSQARLAELAGVSRAAVGLWETGETAPSRRHAPAVASALSLPVGAIEPLLAAPLEPVEIISQAHTIPLMDWDAIARGDKNPAPLEMIFVGIPMPSDAMAFRVPDEAMSPEVNADDLVFVAPSERPQPGDLVVVRIADVMLLRKFVDRGLDRNRRPVFDLLSTGADWPTITCNSDSDHNIIGVVVGVTKTLRR